jgi:putative ABC transport system permease protein
MEGVATPDQPQIRRELISGILFSLRAAVEAVGHNRLRAALTSLGILFGVASVIAMLAIGKGAEQEILAQMKLLGANNIVITPIIEQKEEEATDQTTPQPSRFSPGLTTHDVASISSVISQVTDVTGELVLQSLITREGSRRSAKLVGVDSGYFQLLNLSLVDGGTFTAGQLARGAPVAVIGHGVRTRFFTTEEPLGRRIKVGDTWLTVVGVLADRKVSRETSQKLGVRDANMDVYVPLPTALLRYRNRANVTIRDIQRASQPMVVVAGGQSDEDEDARAERTNHNQLDRIIVHVADATRIPQVVDVMRRMLTRRHNQVVDFEITVPELLLQQEQRTRTIFNVVLGAIASISLLVGGIGIMNIMLASVLERIREIGVRRAVGASRTDILAQFLSEAVLISLSGGVAGILLGSGMSFGIQRVAGIQTVISGVSVAVAFVVSCTVGIVFGLVPAWRAANQDPVTCLRYE